MKHVCAMCKVLSQSPITETGLRMCKDCRTKYGVLTRRQMFRDRKQKAARMAQAYRVADSKVCV